MAFDLKHVSKARLLEVFRERYRNSVADETLRLAEWCIDRVDAADVTDANMQAAFGMTVGQWNSLKARMKVHQNARKTAKAVRGE